MVKIYFSLRLRTWAVYALFVLFFLNSRFSFSQQIIKHFTVNDGLPSSEVYDVHQDFDGYMWFCTDRGISRYNGYEFENFTTNDGLTNNTVFKIFEDKQHNLWFTCFNGTLFTFNYKSKKIEAFELNDQIQKELGPYNWVQNMNFKGNSIYIFSNRIAKGPFKITRRNGKYNLSKAEIKDGILKGDNINGLQLISLNSIGSNHLSEHFNMKLKNVNFGENEINRIIDDFKKDIVPLEKERVLKKTVQSINYFNDFHLNAARNKIEFYKKGNLIKTFNFESSSSERDADGNFWITTVNNGVYLLSNSDISTISLNSILKGDEKITAISSHAGLPIIGTSKGAIIQPDIKKTLIQTHRTEFRINFFSKVNDVTLIPFFTDKQYVIYNDNGLKVKIDEYVKSYNKKLDCRGYYTLMIGNKTVFTISPGHFTVFREGKQLNRVNERILDAIVTNKFEVYYASHSDLFKVLDRNFNNPISLKKDLELENVTIRKIISTKASTLILGTSGSGIIITKNDKLVLKIDKKDGLASDIVNSIYFDEKLNRLWCGTNRGVSLIEFTGFGTAYNIKSITNLTRTDGLPTDFIVDISDTRKKVWVAFDKDVVSIPKDYKIQFAKAPKLNFISLIQNEKNFLNETPQFKHFQNDIRIEYVAMSMKKPVNGKFYRYRLIEDGTNKSNWIFTDEREITFMNLDAGDYTFQVSARSENSAWSEPSLLQFNITPFFLNRWWVRLLFVVILLSIAYTVIRGRVRKVQKESLKELELKNLQFTNQKLELASLRGQMNPHFIFNVLNSIQKNILTGEKWQANNLLTRFSKLIRSSLEYSRIDFISIQKELEFLENYLEIEKQRAPDKFEYKIISELVDDQSEGLIPALLIQPICENAIKHAFEEGNGLLEIKLIQLKNDLLEVTVSDNGIGYRNGEKKNHDFKHSMGLEIVKSRLELFTSQGIESNVQIESLDQKTTKGTKVTLHIPCK